MGIGERSTVALYTHVQFYYFLNLYATVLYHYALYGDLCSEPLGSVSLTEEVT